MSYFKPQSCLLDSRNLHKAQQWERALVIWSEAEAITNTFEDNETKVEILLELGSELIRAQQWEQAIAIIRSLEDNNIKAELLRKLGGELALAQQQEKALDVWAEVEAIADTVEDKEIKAKLLCKLGSELARAHQWERALTVWIEAERTAHTLKESRQRASVLLELARTFENFGRHEQMLKLVQRAWKDADTRACAINLLHLVTGIIPLKVEICITLCEAFSRVDRFLEGSVKKLIYFY